MRKYIFDIRINLTTMWYPCIVLVVILWISVNFTESARILGVFTIPSTSHHIFFQAIVKKLVQQGHYFISITPKPINDTSIEGLKELYIHEIYDVITKRNFKYCLSGNAYSYQRIECYLFLSRFAAEMPLTNKYVQEFLHEDVKVDLLLVQSMHPLNFALAGKYKVPVIGKIYCGYLISL